MDRALTGSGAPALEFTSDLSQAARHRHAVADLAEGAALWRLAGTLAWLDIRLRYRGSLLGPFWLTLSTGVMVGTLGVLYATLWKTNLHDYLPFLSLSLVLWNSFVASVVGDACTCFVQVEGLIRSVRMPFSVHAARVVLRNLVVLAHNVVVVLLVFAIFHTWPGWRGAIAVPGFLLWLVDASAACLLLGAFCARFRDIPPIVGSVMQIAFFVSPIIWKPELVGNAWWLPLNPFFSLLEIVRGPLLGEVPRIRVFAAAIAYSGVLCVCAWLLFARVRGRLAFWV
jgi:lipopolysaccharide transport system permease protein